MNKKAEDAATEDALDTQVGEVDVPPAGEDASEDEVVVTIGEESPPTEEDEEAQRAPEWVRDLRKNYRELQRKNRELEEKLNAPSKGVEQPKLGAKPKLEDFDYDTDAYEAKLAEWFETKRKVEAEEAKAKAEAEAAEKTWQDKLATYGKGKTELKVKDFDDAEDVVNETLNETQRGIIVQGSKNPAVLIYAIGKNPAKAKELASIKDPVEYAWAVAQLEVQLKVTNRKAAPSPEKKVVGSAPVSGAVDSTLDRLRAEAERTGDYTKVTAYKAAKRKS